MDFFPKEIPFSAFNNLSWLQAGMDVLLFSYLVRVVIKDTSKVIKQGDKIQPQQKNRA